MITAQATCEYRLTKQRRDSGDVSVSEGTGIIWHSVVGNTATNTWRGTESLVPL